jgi:hypothetical protein
MNAVIGLLIGVGMILAGLLVTYSDFCILKKKEWKERKSQQVYYEIMLKRSRCSVTIMVFVRGIKRSAK